jgi:predicted hydrocarbon binding protein
VHGIVFEELREYVWRAHGADAWADLLKEAAPGRRFYAPDTDYPDEELEALLAAICRKTGAGRKDLLRNFGIFVAPTLLELYRPLIDPEWGLLDFLEHVEETIHRVVRLDDPTAAPPRLRVERPDPERAIVHYDSKRRMCDFAKGLVLGLREEYGQNVVINELACMESGDDECTLEVAIGS